jgi:hypothetical protein
MNVIDIFGIRYSTDSPGSDPEQPYYIKLQVNGHGQTTCHGKTARIAAERALQWLRDCEEFVVSSAGGTSVGQAVRDAYRSALTYAASLCESKVFDRQDAFDNGCWTCAESIKAELAAINRDNPGDTPVSARERADAPPHRRRRLPNARPRQT